MPLDELIEADELEVVADALRHAIIRGISLTQLVSFLDRNPNITTPRELDEAIAFYDDADFIIPAKDEVDNEKG